MKRSNPHPTPSPSPSVFRLERGVIETAEFSILIEGDAQKASAIFTLPGRDWPYAVIDVEAGVEPCIGLRWLSEDRSVLMQGYVDRLRGTGDVMEELARIAGNP